MSDNNEKEKKEKKERVDAYEKYEVIKAKIIKLGLEPLDLTGISSLHKNVSICRIDDLYHYMICVNDKGEIVETEFKKKQLEDPWIIYFESNGLRVEGGKPNDEGEYDFIQNEKYIFGLRKNKVKKYIDTSHISTAFKGGNSHKKQTRRNKPKNRRRSRRWFF